METLAEESNQIALFKDWGQFYLEISGLTLDVSEFCIENNGFSKQSRLSALVYCPVEHLEQAWQMGQKATLVINQGSTKRYHHGILVMEENALGVKTLDGYIASNIHIASEFWWLAQTYTHCQLYHTDCSQFIEAIIKASGLARDRFKLRDLPTNMCKFRSADGARWLDFIAEQLAYENVATRSIHSKSEELIEFCGSLNQLSNLENSKPRKLSCIEKRYLQPNDENVYFGFGYQAKQTADGYQTQYHLSVPDCAVYPGEWLELENGLYQAINICTTGKHAFTFDNGSAVRIKAPEIESVVTLRTKQIPFAFHIPKKQNTGFSIYTGHIKTNGRDNQTIERDGQGHYNVRFDEATKLVEQAGSAHLKGVKNASLMAGRNHLADFPLRDNAEVALLKTGNDADPVIILGSLHNNQSRVPNNHWQSVIKSYSGNQIQFQSQPNKTKLVIETADSLQSLSFTQENQTITMLSKNGNIVLDAKQDLIFHTPASIHLQTTHAQVERIDNQVDLDSFEGNIIYDIKQRAYFTCKENYNIAVETATVESQDSLTIKATDVIDIHCDELTLNAANGKIELDANIININADEFIVTTPGGEINITDQLLLMKASDATIDIKEAATNAKQSFLGGKPEAAKAKGGTESAEEPAPEVEEAAAETSATKKETSAEHAASATMPNSIINTLPEKGEILSKLIKVRESFEKDGKIKIELEKELKQDFVDPNPCWQLAHKIYMTLKATAELDTEEARKIGKAVSLASSAKEKYHQSQGSQGQHGKLKAILEDQVIEAVKGDTKVTLKQNGELTMSTNIPSLKGASYETKLGIDEKTGLPHVGASVSYDFYEYKLKVKNGEVKLTGNITFGIEFTPIIDGILCSILNDAVRVSDFVNHHITEFELATITMGIGTQVSIGYGAATGLISTAFTPAYAHSIEYKPQSQPFQNEDNSLIVEFLALDLSKEPK